MTIEKGELATSVEKKSKNENHLFWRCWEGQTTSLISFIFGVLVNVGKKILRLQCGFKSWRESILTVVMTSYYENVRSCKRHTVVRRTFCFWRFALLFLGLATHYRESRCRESWCHESTVSLDIPLYACCALIVMTIMWSTTLFNSTHLYTHIHLSLIAHSMLWSQTQCGGCCIHEVIVKPHHK